MLLVFALLCTTGLRPTDSYFTLTTNNEYYFNVVNR